MDPPDSLTTKSAFVTAGRLANSAARLLVGLSVARVFGENVAGNGQFQTVWLLFNTFFPIFLFGLPQSIYYFYPRTDREGRGAFVRQTLVLLQVLGAVFFLFLFFMSPWAARLYDSVELIPHFRWFAVYGFAMVGAGLFDTLFVVMNRHRWQAVVMAVEAVLFVCAAVVPLLLGADLIVVFKALAGLALLKWAFVLAVLRSETSEFRLAWGLPQWGKVRVQLAYAVPLGLTTAAGYLSAYLDKNIVRSFFESDTYAIYVYGAMEVPFVAIVLSAVSTVLVPVISRMHHEGHAEGISVVWQRSIRKTGLLLLPLWVFLMIWAAELYVLAYGAPYRGSAAIFRIYLIKLPLRITAYSMILSVIGFPKLVFRIALVEICVNAVLSLALVRLVGVTGPAVATVAATYLQIWMLIRAIQRKLSLRVGQIFPFGHLFKVLGLSLIGGLASIAAYAIPAPSWMQLVSGAAVFGGVCGLLFWRSGDIALLLNLRRL